MSSLRRRSAAGGVHRAGARVSVCGGLTAHRALAALHRLPSGSSSACEAVPGLARVPFGAQPARSAQGPLAPTPATPRQFPPGGRARGPSGARGAHPLLCARWDPFGLRAVLDLGFAVSSPRQNWNLKLKSEAHGEIAGAAPH